MRINGIDIQVHRRAVKRVTLRIRPDGSVHLVLPPQADLLQAERFVRGKLPWLQAHLARLAARPEPALPGDGDTVRLWGRPVRLKLGEKACLSADALTLPAGAVREGLLGLYRAETDRVMRALIPECQALTGCRAAGWSLRAMKTRWGSCSVRTARIRINTALAIYPEPCMKGVMIHELTHLKEKGHNARFYRLMDEAWPEWRRWDALLKTRDPLMRALFSE